MVTVRIAWPPVRLKLYHSFINFTSYNTKVMYGQCWLFDFWLYVCLKVECTSYKKLIIFLPFWCFLIVEVLMGSWPFWMMTSHSLVHCFVGQEVGTNYELVCGQQPVIKLCQLISAVFLHDWLHLNRRRL